MVSLSVVLKQDRLANSPQKDEIEKLEKKEIWEWVIYKEK